ncbi:MAG: hypothetical protein ACTS5G_01765, partial [Burkholderiales bacterium]
GSDALVDNFSGDNLDRLYALLARNSRARREPVSTAWYVAYSAHGAEELRSRNEALVVDGLTAQPKGSETGIEVTSGAVANTEATGAPMLLGSGKKHPRDTGGQGYMAFHMVPGMDGQGVPAASLTGLFKVNAPYVPITRDKHRVTARIDIGYEPRQVGEIARSRASETGKVTEHGTDQRKVDGQSVAVGTSSSSNATITAGQGNLEAVEKGRSASSERGTTATETTSVSLTGSLSANLSLKAQLSAGAKVSGKLLGSLLMLAGPEGAALYGVLRASSALEGTELTLGLSGESGFTLAGQLSGTVGKTWSNMRTELERSGSSKSNRSEASTNLGTAASATAGASKTQTDQSSSEQGSHQKDSASTRESTGETRTTNEFQAAVKNVDMSFQVE